MYRPFYIDEENIESKKSKFPMVEPKKQSEQQDVKPKKEVKKKDSDNNYKLDLTSMIDGGTSIALSSAPKQQKDSKKKTSSSNAKKSKIVEVSMADKDNGSTRELNDFESNVPYSEKYEETNNLLRGTIAQLEYGLQELQQDANIIRASKTMRKKYDYLSEIHGTIGNYLGNKISAIRELNNTINKCNEYEFKRYKELKLNMEQDDDKAIMEAYQAFVNTPVGSYGFSPLGPSSQDLTLRSPNLNGIEVQANGAGGYDDYIRNMTPQQHMMALENNPDVKQVVIYDQRTGARYFEVLNMQTMEPVPNTDKMDMMLIDEFDLDLKNKVARSINMNITMPLVVIGDSTLNEY